MNKDLSVYQFLLRITGIGPSTSLQLLASLGISPRTKYNKLAFFKENLLLQALASLRKSSSFKKYNSVPCSFSTEKVLLKNTQDNLSKYISNLSYRGARFKLGFSVNGGRTRSNGRTAKKLHSSLRAIK